MSSPKVIRAALATRLKSITGLQIYDRWPNSLNFPCAVIDVGPSEPLQTLGRGDLTKWTFQVYVLAGMAGDYAQGSDNLDGFLATSSTGGIFGAIAADPRLGNTVDTVFVRNTPGQYNQFEINENQSVMGAVIDLETWST